MKRALLLGCSVALFACGDDDRSGDTGIMGDVGVDAGSPDGGPPDGGPPDSGPPDSGPPPMSALFGECVDNSQCPGDGAFCRTAEDGFPQGSCTLPCIDRGPCDDDVVFNHCLDLDGMGGTICEQRCVNSADCGRPGYVCVGRGEIDAASGVCIGFCSSDEDCGGTSECNVYSAGCVAAGTLPTEGAVTGEPCANDDACLSRVCIEQGSGTTSSGFVGGMCVGNCILPPGYNSSSFFTGDTLPTEECPGGDVCFPNGALTQREPGLCIAACDSAADCRPGYQCEKTFSEKTFTNGVCFPIDCAVDACPAGTTCNMVRRSDGRISNNCG